MKWSNSLGLYGKLQKGNEQKTAEHAKDFCHSLNDRGRGWQIEAGTCSACANHIDTNFAIAPIMQKLRNTSTFPFLRN